MLQLPRDFKESVSLADAEPGSRSFRVNEIPATIATIAVTLSIAYMCHPWRSSAAKTAPKTAMTNPAMAFFREVSLEFIALAFLRLLS